MPDKNIMPNLSALQQLLAISDENFLRDMLTKMLNMMMELEVSSQKSTRERKLASGFDEVKLQIPKLRSGESYYPCFLEPRRMVDKVLVNVIQEVYINGVSTQMVDKLVEDLGLKIDKSAVSRLCK